MHFCAPAWNVHCYNSWLIYVCARVSCGDSGRTFLQVPRSVVVISSRTNAQCVNRRGVAVGRATILSRAAVATSPHENVAATASALFYASKSIFVCKQLI